MNPVCIRLYRWAGRWGPWRIRVPCGECALTEHIIRDVLQHEVQHIDCRLEIRDWLSHWWQPLPRGGWHAPIVLVDNRLISQGGALNRGVLAQAIAEAHARRNPIQGNHVFGKHGCPYCDRARLALQKAGIGFDDHDVIKEPAALFEMLARVKAIIGPHRPITVPQIWIEGEYIGGADALSQRLGFSVTPNPQRGYCSLSPTRKASADSGI